MEAVAIADVVLCHQSTVAFQALAVKKPVLHLIPEGQFFDSLPLQKGLAHKVVKVENFNEELHRALGRPVEDFSEKMGIPQNSVEACARAIEEAIGWNSLLSLSRKTELGAFCICLNQKIFCPQLSF